METGTSGPWSGHIPGTPGYRRLLLGLFLAGVATFAQLYSPQGLLPLISEDLSITASDAALMVSLATLGLAIGVIPWSYAGDRFGRKRVMGWAIMAACAFSLTAVAVPGLEAILAFRLLEGFALGGVPALALAYLNEEVSAASSALAAGTYISGTTLGGLAGRLLAAPIGELTDWRLGMLAVTVLSVACAVAFLLLAPTARGFTPHRTTFREAVHALAGNLRSPALLVIYAQGFLLMGGFVAMYNYLGFHLAGDPFNLPIALVSLVFVAYLAGTWTSPLAGRLAGRHGRGPVLLVSTAIMITGVLLTLVPSLWVVLPATIVFTGGFFGAHAVASGWAGAAAVAGRAQSASLYNFGYYAGSSLFGWLGGVFLAGAGWPGTVLMTAVLAVVAAILGWFLRSR
ncbi:MFS transporter [Citricoccus nitrophenolicus]|uniref:Putative MFS family arabinose efflux permease n=1 Tax=Citricoccus muralis TaxID=169134 RepID=A0A3D9LFQ9_9MICC|nr:MFS transporter [Citricoccus muralis]REE05095.1 putative MFS family arabinose efflux permease [Citricoccus muralis]